MVAPALGVLCASLLVAACGGGGGAYIYCVVQTNPPTLVFPIPSATAVPDRIGVVVMTNAVSSFIVTLIDKNGNVIDAGALGPPPSPFPSPAAQTPGPSASQFEAASIPLLQSQTVYTVRVLEVPACTAPQTVQIGSFTTN